MDDERVEKILGIMAHRIQVLEKIVKDLIESTDVYWTAFLNCSNEPHILPYAWMERWDEILANMLKDQQEYQAEQSHALYEVKKQVKSGRKSNTYNYSNIVIEDDNVTDKGNSSS